MSVNVAELQKVLGRFPGDALVTVSKAGGVVVNPPGKERPKTIIAGGALKLQAVKGTKGTAGLETIGS